MRGDDGIIAGLAERRDDAMIAQSLERGNDASITEPEADRDDRIGGGPEHSGSMRAKAGRSFIIAL